jgi:hypothetical protein
MNDANGVNMVYSPKNSRHNCGHLLIRELLPVLPSLLDELFESAVLDDLHLQVNESVSLHKLVNLDYVRVLNGREDLGLLPQTLDF